MSIVLDKFLYSVISSIIFFALANNVTYNLADLLFGGKGTISTDGCPTATGHFAMTIVFFILILAIMFLYDLSKKQKTTFWLLIQYSFLATLLFFILTNAEVFTLTGKLTGGLTADSNGCASVIGLFSHTLLFFIIIFSLIFFPYDK